MKVCYYAIFASAKLTFKCEWQSITTPIVADLSQKINAVVIITHACESVYVTPSPSAPVP